MGATFRGMAAGVLSLIALQAIVSQNGSGKVAGAFGLLNTFVERALDPSVPLIPDRRVAAGPSPYSDTAAWQHTVNGSLAAQAAQVAANGGHYTTDSVGPTTSRPVAR